MIVNCDFCEVEFNKNPSLVERTNYNFCTYGCNRRWKKQSYISEWKAGLRAGQGANGILSKTLREYLEWEQHGKCAMCGSHWWTNSEYDGPIPLEADHVDGNWENSSEDNLRMICPTCHATTSTYKNKNNGNGRSR